MTWWAPVAMMVRHDASATARHLLRFARAGPARARAGRDGRSGNWRARFGLGELEDHAGFPPDTRLHHASPATNLASNLDGKIQRRARYRGARAAGIERRL